MAFLSNTTSRSLLRRMLDEPELAALVQTLEPPQLARVIERVGLEDSSELLQFATTEQLESVIDDDVWRAAFPGRDPSFDAARFLLWLEVMLECGESWLTERLVALPEDLVTLAFARLLLVLDLDDLRRFLSPDDEDGDLTEKAFGNFPSEEFDEYVVIGRQHEGWDSLLGVLLALDERQHEYLERVLARSRHISHEYIEDNGGLYAVLTADEALEEDLRADHEARRAGRGFIGGRRASQFLELALRAQPFEVLAERDDDPITRAYFRELTPPNASRGRHERANESVARPPGQQRLLALIEASSASAEDTREVEATSVFTPSASASAERLAQRAMARLVELDPGLHSQRLEELAYLANVLIADADFRGQPLRSFDAATRVLDGVERGLGHVLSLLPGAPSDAIALTVAVAALRDHSAPRLFRIGYRLPARQKTPTPLTAGAPEVSVAGR
jgi:hypothetical protein